jgi:mRNA interferase MazF
MAGKCTRGTVIEVNLDPSVGREIMKVRPCVVVQNDIGNKYAQTTIIAPITDAEKARRPSPVYVPVPQGEGGLTKDSIILCNQIRVVDESRLGRTLGKLADATMARVDQGLRISLGLAPLGLGALDH